MKLRFPFAAAAAVLLAFAPGFLLHAGDGADRTRPKHNRQPRITDFTVTGKVVRDVSKDKDGVTHVSYSVMTPVGDRARLLTGNRAEDGQPTLSQLDKFTDKTVIVIGKGHATDEGDQTVVYIVSVTRILVMDPDAGK